MKWQRLTSVTLFLAAVFFVAGGVFVFWGRFFADSGRFVVRSASDSDALAVYLPLETPQAREMLLKVAESYLNAEKRRWGSDYDATFYARVIQDGFARLDSSPAPQVRFTAAEIFSLFAETGAESDDSLAEATAFLTEIAPANSSDVQLPVETAQKPLFLPETLSGSNPLDALRFFRAADLIPIPTESARLANELMTPISFRAGLLFSILSLALSFVRGQNVWSFIPEALYRPLAEFLALVSQTVRLGEYSHHNTCFALLGYWNVEKFFVPRHTLADRLTVVLLL